MVKIIFPIIIFGLGLVSDTYLYHRYINAPALVWRCLWWLPSTAIICLFLKTFFFGQDVSQNTIMVNIFLLLMGLFFFPKIVFAIFSLIPRVGTYIGGFLSASIIALILYGVTYGFSQVKVTKITYESTDVPESFDGYRIAQFSDMHSSSFFGPYYHLLQESMDTINALNPDIICFVGDIVNFSPKELEPHISAYSSLKAKDGVFSVMGNHDYATYMRLSPEEMLRISNITRQKQKDFGWRLLKDENVTITRGNDSISIIGEENWGLPPFPQFGKLNKAIKGANGSLSIMLSHDPTAWRNHILPKFRPNITLSGHTHGSQFSLFGFTPAAKIYKEWGGEYRDGESMLYVSTGLGGNFPIRINMPREIVLITLKHKRK